MKLPVEHLIENLEVYIVVILLIAIAVLVYRIDAHETEFKKECDSVKGMVVESLCLDKSSIILMRN
jgi:hypothetical protein